MVFSDLLFIYLFLPVCLICYYLTDRTNVRNNVLTVFSLLFYSFGEPVWVGLLLVSAFTDYSCGLFIERHRNEKKAVFGLIASLVINLGMLFVFKYSGFTVETVNNLFGTSFHVPSFSLPIGISFYTFQTISYTVDVYRRKADVQHDFCDFLLYVSMFFQLVAGPIVRYTDIAAEITERHNLSKDTAGGIVRFIYGLGKKVILANCAGSIADSIFSGDISSVLAAWTGGLAFSLQIYYDFSGYSDMAIGLGQLFGFHLTENFNYPYISRSASEFWRRWHMSLGAFFRDYVYIPMGGNRRHQLLNIAVVWFLTGLWHGASFNYILWGLYFGLLVGLEKLFLGKLLEKIPRIFSHIYLLAVVLFGWLLFYFEDLSRLKSCLAAMFGIGEIPLSDFVTVSLLKNNLFVIIAAVILCCPVYRVVKDKTGAAGKIVFGFAVLIISSLLLVKQSYNPFIYFRY